MYMHMCIAEITKGEEKQKSRRNIRTFQYVQIVHTHQTTDMEEQKQKHGMQTEEKQNEVETA